MVRALASRQCGPGLIPRPGVICGLSLLVLFLALRGFSLGTPVFPPPQKPTFPNSNSIRIIVKHFVVSLWLRWWCEHSPCLTVKLHLACVHVACFYRVIQTRVEVWENEKCFGNTSRRRVFPQLSRVLPNFHECLYNSIETRSTCFLFLLENNATRTRKTTC